MDLGPFKHARAGNYQPCGLQWGAGALRQEEAPWHPTIYGWVQSQKTIGKHRACRLQWKGAWQV